MNTLENEKSIEKFSYETNNIKPTSILPLNYNGEFRQIYKFNDKFFIPQLNIDDCNGNTVLAMLLLDNDPTLINNQKLLSLIFKKNCEIHNNSLDKIVYNFLELKLNLPNRYLISTGFYHNNYNNYNNYVIAYLTEVMKDNNSSIILQIPRKGVKYDYNRLNPITPRFRFIILDSIDNNKAQIRDPYNNNPIIVNTTELVSRILSKTDLTIAILYFSNNKQEKPYLKELSTRNYEKDRATDLLLGNNPFFYNKYLKYKNKYLQLKLQTKYLSQKKQRGGVDNINNYTIINMLLEFYKNQDKYNKTDIFFPLLTKYYPKLNTKEQTILIRVRTYMYSVDDESQLVKNLFKWFEKHEHKIYTEFSEATKRLDNKNN
jgi:hypothetical protein